ncbi:MAG: ferritin-like domain-containing protein [Myxococcales bacterium]|nr:ferritin-like domain-containing protein [Myxococcales bacterium]MCB9575946.1 ferritin-like domain-containing protein [Polyangiaceae bacterium]
MDYPQKNPVPLPASGASQAIQATIDTVFDWQYALKEKKLLALYEKGKSLSWNATDLDWSTDVDVERLAREAQIDVFMNTLMDPPKKFTLDTAVQFRLHMNAFMLSQFLHGEQGALIATAKIVQTAPTEEAKFYAANQVADEARHVEVYHRYLTEKLGLSYEVHPSLAGLLKDIVEDSRWDVTYLGMQIMVEGLALAAFGMMRLVMQSEPLIQDITGRIMQDESRHVAFGVLSLADLYTGQLSATELREREDFVIESTALLRERLLMQPVFERLGWDSSIWVPWMTNTPFQRGFRQMMFSKIVPNLRRLGLLTPRVRQAFDKLDILRFENEKDSVEEPEVAPPAELVQMLMSYMAGQGTTPAG